MHESECNESMNVSAIKTGYILLRQLNQFQRPGQSELSHKLDCVSLILHFIANYWVNRSHVTPRPVIIFEKEF